MAFNKLQGLTLLVTFFVICLLNAKSYDFAEADQQVFEAVSELMDGDMTGEAVEQASKKLLGFLPRMPAFKDPKVLGAIAAAVAAIVAGGAMYVVKSRKIEDWTKHVKEIMEKRFTKEVDAKLPDTEKTQIKDARDAIKAKIEAILDDSDLKKHEQKAEELMKKIYTAQKEVSAKAGDLISLLKNIINNKPAVMEPKVEYTKALKEAAAKAEAKPSEDTKNMLSTLDADLVTLTTAYAKSLQSRKEVEAMVKIVNLSDKDLLTVDMSVKPEDMKKGSKK